MISTDEQPIARSSEIDTKLVYVVDDEAMIGDVVQIILSRDGFRPRFFQDPERALQAIIEEETKPALLLTDLVMSPINGMELIERSKRVLPELRTILYSGNAGPDILLGYAVKPDAFLRKPFLPRTLTGLVRSTLSSS